MFSEAELSQLTQVFKLISDESRMRIIALLAHHEERNVSQLCDDLGQSQPAVSHHLALLRVAGAVESRRDGKHNYYSIRPEFFGELVVQLMSAIGKTPRELSI